MSWLYETLMGTVADAKEISDTDFALSLPVNRALHEQTQIGADHSLRKFLIARRSVQGVRMYSNKVAAVSRPIR